MIKLACKNIKSLFLHERLIAVMFLLCVFASSLIMHFAYGLYQNFHVILTDAVSDIPELDIEIVDASAVTKERLLECLYGLPDEINDAVQQYFLTPEVTIRTSDGSIQEESSLVTCRFAVFKQQIINSPVLETNIKSDGLLRGEYYTQEQQHNGAQVAVVAETRDFSGTGHSWLSEYITRTDGENQYIEIQDHEYCVIGYSSAFMIDIPLQSLDDTTRFGRSIDLIFGEKQSEMITRRQYNMIKEAFEQTFGPAISVPELELPDQSNLYLYRTILLISVLIALLAALNFSQLYRYILDKRQRTIAIMRLCGCGKQRAVRIFLVECAFLMIPAYILSAVIFAKIVLPSFRHMFEYMEAAFSVQIYAVMFAIYLLTSLCVLWGMLNHRIGRASISEMQKRR